MNLVEWLLKKKEIGQIDVDPLKNEMVSFSFGLSPVPRSGGFPTYEGSLSDLGRTNLFVLSSLVSDVKVPSLAEVLVQGKEYGAVVFDKAGRAVLEMSSVLMLKETERLTVRSFSFDLERVFATGIIIRAI